MPIRQVPVSGDALGSWRGEVVVTAKRYPGGAWITGKGEGSRTRAGVACSKGARQGLSESVEERRVWAKATKM